MRYIEKLNSVLVRTTNNFIKCVALFSSVLITSSCGWQQSPNDIFSEYRERLTNVLGNDSIAPFGAFEFIKLPRYRENDNQQRIELKRFYQLPECGIKTIIAERNTSLGKLSSPSNRLHYEITLQQALAKCLAIVSSEESVNIKELQWKKLGTLKMAVSQLLNGSMDIRNSISSPGLFIDEEAAYGTSSVAWQDLLSQLQPLLANNINDTDITRIDWQHSRLERNLRSLAEEKLVSRLINTFAVFNHHLPVVTAGLVETQRALQCHNPKTKQQIEYVGNISQLFFIKKLQPIVSKANDSYYKIMATLKALYQQSGPVNDYFERYLHQAFIELKANLQAHVAALQALREGCG